MNFPSGTSSEQRTEKKPASNRLVQPPPASNVYIRVARYDDPRAQRNTGPRIAIIGAGMSGMLMAIKLQEAGISNFELLEKREAIGGAWRDNSYPGLKCDVPAHMFTYSFAPNPDYSERFATGQEIRTYFERIYAEYDLRKKTRFNTDIEEARFCEDHWILKAKDGSVIVADVVIWAGGILHHPLYPNLPDIDSFAGDCFHTARWNHDVSLAGKRIGIIGTGSTAAQLVPAIAKEAAKVVVYQRTPHWIFPLPNRRYSQSAQDRVQRFPLYAKWLRWSYGKLLQWTFTRAVIGNAFLQRAIQRECKRYLNRKIKCESLRQKLTPDYKAGCKRVILARGYYESLQRENTSLNCEKISRVTPEGVLTVDGQLENLDVLIFATGFQAQNFMRPMRITGRDGITLNDIWKDSVYAHRSVALPGLPNFFMIIGPQSPTGNYSAISVAETQVAYLLQLIKRIRTGDCDLIEPKEDISQVLQNKIKQAMAKTVWVSGCSSWYLGESGQPAMWPWTFERFQADLRRPRFTEYTLSLRPKSTPRSAQIFYGTHGGSTSQSLRQSSS